MQINQPHPKEPPTSIHHSKTMSHTQDQAPKRHSSLVPHRPDAPDHARPPTPSPHAALHRPWPKGNKVRQCLPGQNRGRRRGSGLKPHRRRPAGATRRSPGRPRLERSRQCGNLNNQWTNTASRWCFYHILLCWPKSPSVPKLHPTTSFHTPHKKQSPPSPRAYLAYGGYGSLLSPAGRLTLFKDEPIPTLPPARPAAGLTFLDLT